jgi:hypothetical protein
MSETEQYDWHDCKPYLKHMIVRVGDWYRVLTPDSGEMYNVRFETIESAQKAVEGYFLVDLMFELLIVARDQNVISEQQREDITKFVGSKTYPVPIQLYKFAKTCTTNQSSEVH